MSSANSVRHIHKRHAAVVKHRISSIIFRSVRSGREISQNHGEATPIMHKTILSRLGHTFPIAVRMRHRLQNSPTACGITYSLSTVGNPQGFTLLMYHGVLERPDPYSSSGIHLSMFEAQLAMLSRFCSVISLDEITDRIERGQRLPPRCVALTFDDGYRSMHTLAAPLLRRYRLPAILYVAVQAIERGFLWPDLLRYTIQNAHDPRVELETLQDGEPRSFELVSLSDRIQTARQLNLRLKQLQNGDKWRVLDELARKLLGRSPDDVTIPGLMLSWDQLRSMARDGVEIGAHTMTHPVLTRMPEQEAEDEIRTSRRALEQALGVPVRHFAYPNGQPEDFSPAVRRLVEEAGFRSACTTVQGCNRPSDDRLTLKRIDGKQHSLRRLARIMAERAS